MIVYNFSFPLIDFLTLSLCLFIVTSNISFYYYNRQSMGLFFKAIDQNSCSNPNFKMLQAFARSDSNNSVQPLHEIRKLWTFEIIVVDESCIVEVHM